MTSQTAQDRRLGIVPSRHFPDWLFQQAISIGFTTYQAGKLFLVGMQDNGRLSIAERSFSRCMGLWGDGQTLWMSSQYQLWRFENALAPGERHDGFDRLYIPHTGITTGDLDIHDVALAKDGVPVFVNTLFSCLATPSRTRSFRPIWKPPFVTGLLPEDRCHLNGLCISEGVPKYVTAVASTDVADGWRDLRRDGGIAMDVVSAQIIASGLSMPHSPRLHDGRLWLLNSGTGYFGSVDLATGKFEPLAFCPGYLRGLTFVGGHAIVGVSRPRNEKTFEGLALDAELARRNAAPQCGILIIDLATGAIVHWLKFENVIDELYDVVCLPGVRRPMALGFKTDEIRRIVTIEQ